MVSVDSPSTVQDLLATTPGNVRVAGAGHSFTPLLTGADMVLNLDDYQGIVTIDAAGQTVTVRAGTRLRTLNAQLHEHGLAMRNLGDIDVQSIAGATATATHGTGARLPCMAAEVTGLELVRADGEIVQLGQGDPDLVQGARVAVGCLGVITAMDLNVVPSYRLHRRTWSEPVDVALASAMQRWEDHRNYEFFYIPFSGYVLSITHDLTEDPIRRGEKGDDDKAVRDLRLARTLLGWAPALRRAVLRREISRFPAEDSVDYSWKLLASERNVRFKEMEYHLPVDVALALLPEIISLIERDRRDVFFPIEVRQTAADDSWLSPFNDGPRISIAVHAWYRDEHQFMFDTLEPLFLAAGGRPHWGKLHSLEMSQLAALYPRFGDFVDLRDQWDPKGRFLNPHTAQMFTSSDVRI